MENSFYNYLIFKKLEKKSVEYPSVFDALFVYQSFDEITNQDDLIGLVFWNLFLYFT